MPWAIEYYATVDGKRPVEKFIDSLSPEGRANYVFIADLLEEYGLNVKEPYVKPITGYKKLFEIRIKDRSNSHRIFYFASTGKKFILLHGFTKKTKKAPRKEIEIAVKRMQDYISRKR
ncbi:MAG: type II toxin-antitoxin system RelE/ParE family toxin [Nitrospirae bacterium CG_4_10_14_3_um_filter_44_29]|nr:type II toxin-antitoxin system RelE/ParE family toxin [Nitrospirota bacterium]PIP70806.1 MAG: addiction module toxin RelE [Nitrospirae bacterium CG22_combo_CG10-13_8_21_14_all_44_11]PIV41077.1 MAG: type II toxin-antitoxin system RelE/ParE family toxin [Nitrospirae bacterium CG02_land_8_20_14_3_00_44_33]PIV67369.1 MAG: type II toxin-antitoxin system RelE/ParE family toxin [Nitrospirae bacterium CG01_land_8_20_14_3_00_44_22]PIW88825.1 MAG: type II toxin-antitoxin system RelE/ParE family toxin 